MPGKDAKRAQGFLVAQLAQALQGAPAQGLAPADVAPVTRNPTQRAGFLDALLLRSRDKNGEDLAYTGALPELLGGGLRDVLTAAITERAPEQSYRDQILSRRRGENIDRALESGDLDALQRLDPSAASDQLGVDSRQFELREAQEASRGQSAFRRVRAIQATGRPEEEQLALLRQHARQFPDVIRPEDVTFAQLAGIGALANAYDTSSGARQGSQSTFEQRRQAYLAANPGDEEGALSYAAGNARVSYQDTAQGRAAITTDAQGRIVSRELLATPTQAARNAEIIKRGEAAGKATGTQSAEGIADVEAQLDGITQTEELITEAQAALNNGIITGPLAEQRAIAARLFSGLTGNAPSALAATADFFQITKELSINLLQSGAFGDGRSLTDADRDAADRLAAASDSKDVAEIRAQLSRLLKSAQISKRRLLTQRDRFAAQLNNGLTADPNAELPPNVRAAEAQRNTTERRAAASLDDFLR